MPIDVERLITQLEVNQRRFDQQLKAANQNSKRRTRSIQRDFDRMNHRVSRSLSNAAKSASVLHGPLGGVASRLSAIGSLAAQTNVFLSGTSLAMAGVGFAAHRALRAFQKFETQQLVTEQVIRATGGAAGKTVKDLEDLAQSVGFATLASVEGARKAATQLLTFRSISGETFDRTLRLAQDLATVGFGTLESSAVQLGKALEDPKTGLTALRRVGVSFSETQKQVIQDLFDTGRVAQAQEKILDGLEQQVGGAGKASGQGLAGAYDTLSEATDILLERWGKQIAEAIKLQAVIRGIADVIDEVNARATPEGQLIEVERKIEVIRDEMADPAIAVGRNVVRKHFGLDGAETELRKLLKERDRLQMDIFRSAEAASMASLRGLEAQKDLERERSEGVLTNLRKELDLARLTNTEREIAVQLAKAGVSAESELGKRIAQSVREIEAAEKSRSDARKGKGERERAAKKAQREAQAVLTLIETLEVERALIGATARERAIANALRQAGAAATDDQRQKIIELVAATHDENAALERTRERWEAVRDTGRDALRGLVDDLIASKSATDALADALDRVADRLLDSAFDSLFGGGGGFGNLFGSILAPFSGQAAIARGGGIGLYADGGVHTASGPRQLPRFSRGGISNRAAIFGEAGPEAAVPLPDGRRIPVDLDLTGRGRGGPDRPGVARELIEVRLIDDSGRMADIADRRIETATGPIVRISVDQSRQAARADFAANLGEYALRRRDRAPWS